VPNGKVTMNWKQYRKKSSHSSIWDTILGRWE